MDEEKILVRRQGEREIRRIGVEHVSAGTRLGPRLFNFTVHGERG